MVKTHRIFFGGGYYIMVTRAGLLPPSMEVCGILHLLYSINRNSMNTQWHRRNRQMLGVPPIHRGARTEACWCVRLEMALSRSVCVCHQSAVGAFFEIKNHFTQDSFINFRLRQLVI